jgi:predicted kinase
MASAQTYVACLAEARQVLGIGFPVVLDAVFSKPEERAAAGGLASELGVPFHGV